MKRDIEKELSAWKKQEKRLPLLLRGARQVGKTYVVEKFGEEFFPGYVSLNFEYQPELKRCFDNFNPRDILNKIELIYGVNIIPGQTLLFLDEIQECPLAITALRYFKEKMPELHVIAAGSLLEFALSDVDFKMPVGRVQYIYLKPLSFAEFLSASGNNKLKEYLDQLKIKDKIDRASHDRLLELLRLYTALGGMPAVLSEYLQTQRLLNPQNIQSAILNTFRNDFSKYAKRTNHKYLQKIYEMAPRLIGQRFKYAKVDKDMRSRDLKAALENLEYAGLIYKILATSGEGLPLGASVNETKFKIIFLDMGLALNSCNMALDINFTKDLLLVNRGAIAEQFVGQELLAYYNKFTNSKLFFWARDKKNSEAEVDYIINIGSKIFPIEIKSGKPGTLKSLKIFLTGGKSPFGIRISQQPLSFHDNVLSIPLYMIKQIPRLVKEQL